MFASVAPRDLMLPRGLLLLLLLLLWLLEEILLQNVRLVVPGLFLFLFFKRLPAV